MGQNDSEFDVYYIPPNFIDSGTVLGGLFKLRNTVEAGILAFCAGVPAIMLAPDITSKVLILCFTALPLAIIALIGVSGESLFSYILGVLKFLKKRSVLGADKENKARKRNRRKNIEKKKELF